MKRNYSDRTIKLLFGRATSCAYPDCSQPLIFENRGRLTVGAQIAHIRSEAANGPRFDPTYPQQLVDQEENLILLCGLHHKPVDEHASIYPVEELLEWKRRQVSATPTPTLTEPQIAAVVQHYDLNSLEPMGFERLCQALMARAFGVGTRLHGGYGSDGGLDASFLGRALYPSKVEPWDGYVVMQAKLIRAAANKPAGADQLRQWIRHEVGRWAPGRRPETAAPPADYLLLATNLSIPAALRSEGWSQIDRLVCETSGGTLKGWEIWDETRIFELLDAYPDVRYAFAPLMTSNRLVANYMDRHQDGVNR